MGVVIYEIKNKVGDIVMLGSVENIDSKIYPMNHIGDKSLPYEIELQYFKVEGYSIKYFDVDITWDAVMDQQIVF